MCMANIAAFIRHIIINEFACVFNRSKAFFYINFVKKVINFRDCHTRTLFCI